MGSFKVWNSVAREEVQVIVCYVSICYTYVYHATQFLVGGRIIAQVHIEIGA